MPKTKQIQHHTQYHRSNRATDQHHHQKHHRPNHQINKKKPPKPYGKPSKPHTHKKEKERKGNVRLPPPKTECKGFWRPKRRLIFDFNLEEISESESEEDEEDPSLSPSWRSFSLILSITDSTPELESSAMTGEDPNPATKIRSFRGSGRYKP